ncbi:MAG: hypothetical protein WC188_10335, partial [Candidatus Caldatribacteriota bacterium]
MLKPNNTDITEMTITLYDNDSLSWYRYHFVFLESGLSFEYLLGNDVIDKKSYDLETGNRLLCSIDNLN